MDRIPKTMDQLWLEGSLQTGKWGICSYSFLKAMYHCAYFYLNGIDQQ